MKQAVKHQMKNVPEAQMNMVLGMIEKNPDLFEKIAKEIEAEVKKGTEQNAAALSVMNKYKNDLQKIA